MIKLTYRDLNTGALPRALGKLAQCQEFDPRLAYNIGRIVDKVESVMKQARMDMRNLIEKYAEKDEKGKVKLAEPRDGTSFTIPEDLQAEFDQAQEKLLNNVIEIERQPISLDAIAPAKMTPNEVLALDPILDLRDRPTLVGSA